MLRAWTRPGRDAQKSRSEAWRTAFGRYRTAGRRRVSDGAWDGAWDGALDVGRDGGLGGGGMARQSGILSGSGIVEGSNCAGRRLF